MRILVQDRGSVRNVPKEIWITSVGGQWAVVGTSYLGSYFGVYSNEERAREVLRELFQFLRDKKGTYIMPAE